MTQEPLQAATELTMAGFAVVPSMPRSKEIRVPRWPDLHLTLDDLPRYFNGAEQNISINWRASNGRCALDLDAAEAEELAPILLPTATPAFGRGRRLRQVVFECPEATNFKLRRHGEMLVEVLAGGCSSLAPGSTHPDGAPVDWCPARSPVDHTPLRLSLNELQRLAHLIAGGALLLRCWREIANQGIRHDSALQLTGSMLHAHWPPDDVRRVLGGIFELAGDSELKDRLTAIETTIVRQMNGQPFCGLPEMAKTLPAELTEALVEFWGLGAFAMPSGASISAGVPSIAGPSSESSEVLLTWACDVVEERLRWHWYGVLAAGKTTLLAGDPGCGKSTLSAAIAAAYSTGTPFPGSTERRPAQKVLICAAEDGASDTKRPRLVAAGADLSKVAFLDLVQQGSRQRYFTLTDIPALDALLTRHPNEFGLLVIDPIGSYLGGKDSHRDSDVRELMRPLGVLAEEHRISILLIAHLNKSSVQTAMNRVTGAKAFVAAARIAWLVARDPQDADTVLVVQLKTNITERLDGLSYHIVKETLPSGAEVSKLVWNDLPVTLTADELLRQGVEKTPLGREQAEEWLQERLADGPVAVRELKDECDLTPFSWDTVKRAAKGLGVRGSGEKKSRVWMLSKQAPGAVIRVDFGGPRRPDVDIPAPPDMPSCLDEIPIIPE